MYIRWSTDEQGQGTTLAVQREACAHYCQSQGWLFQEELVYVDEGCSGGSLDRPSLTRLRAAVRAGQVECVVVYKLDRLSRSLLDCVTLVRREWEGKCALYSTKENFDTHSPVGQMVFNILVSFAEFERNLIRDRTLSGKLKRAEQGRNAGQRYPYGYRKGAHGTWLLDGWDQQRRCFTGPAAIVRRIFTEFLTGSGATSIADRLRREGVPAPMGRNWRFGAVLRILDCPNYAGDYVYGLREGPRRAKGPPKYRVSGAIPPVVSNQEFLRVQELRWERRNRAPRTLASTYLLSGLARCRRCGAPVNGCTGPNKRYYVCTGRLLLKNCDCAYMDAEKLEKAVLKEVQTVIPVSSLHRPADRLQAEIFRKVAEQSYVVKAAQVAVAEARRKERRLADAFLSSSLDANAYKGLMAAVDAEMRQAQAHLQAARQGLREAQAAARGLQQLPDLSRLVDPWLELTVAELKQVLRELVACLTVYQQRSPYRGSRHTNPHPLYVEWQPRLDLATPAGSSTSADQAPDSNGGVADGQ